ncbi:MAG: carbon starvation CstA family protein, partial [Alphaproteobacteria bacterium]
VYAYIASIIPVNILLQPRDYLSTFILYFGLFFGYLGLVLTHPPLRAPAFISTSSAQGPIWPMLCVIVACGAISGFHALISGGTTSKQLSNERFARRISYGAMALEAVLATLALLAVAAGLYWTKDGAVAGLVYPELIKGGNWTVTFGKGYGQLVAPIFGNTFGMLIAIVTLNAFVMTTLDSATRINRYITEELFGEALKIKMFRNRYVSTLFVVGFALFLAMGSWKFIWPVFGASNQLVAALVLITVTVYLIKRAKPAIYTAVPAGFMLLTTLAALGYESGKFFREGKILLFAISLALVVLALMMLRETFCCVRKGKK